MPESKPNETVLIVDDSPAMLALLRLTLQLEGYEVLTATSGTEAINSAKSHAPNLILLDVMIPDPDGFEVAQILQRDEKTSDIPIIFVTAKNETDHVVHGLEVAVDYIVKPFAMSELVARVHTAVRQIRRLKSLTG